jgi:hypothetical protein
VLVQALLLLEPGLVPVVWLRGRGLELVVSQLGQELGQEREPLLVVVHWMWKAQHQNAWELVEAGRMADFHLQILRRRQNWLQTFLIAPTVFA